MAESCVATIPDLMPHRRLRPPAADPPRHWNTTPPSPTSATHIGKRLAGKLHEPFERAGGGRAISPTSPDSTAKRPANNAGQPAAERVERRAGTEGNAGQQSTRRAQDRESVSQALERVRQAAKQRRKERVTALFHHINSAMLRTAFFALKRDAAAGVDGVTWQDYEADLDRRIEDLRDRVHRGAYRAQPSRRRYIPKPDGRQRPLAVAALQDKVVH